MAIINLGQIGEQRESWAKPLADRESKYTDALIKAKATEAEAESKRKDESRAYIKQAYKNYWKKSETERGLFDNTPEGKEFHKLAKKHIDEWYDKEGKPIRYPIENEPTPEEENAAKLALERAKRGLDPSPEGAAAIIKVIQNGIMDQTIEEAEGAQAIKYYMQFIQSRFTGGLGGGAGADTQDPLNLMGR